ncbi:hypothetical protein [Maritalea sp.]|uniref:hypothetical protein n=1 Tax=Maritalea sp. TaxID=2003361 RepID=UPI003EF7211C
MSIFASFFGFFEAQAFSMFMIGWIVTLAGGITHVIGGGFRDGASKVPVLGNWEAVKAGEKGYVQQWVGIWILRLGLAMAFIGGLIHFL